MSVNSSIAQQAAVIVFAKAPVADRVKTRLIPALGGQGAAELALNLLRHTLEQVAQIDACSILCMHPEPDHPDWKVIKPEELISFEQWAQSSGDLGSRLRRAYQEASEHFDYSVFVGMDCPDLSADHITLAIEGLAHRDLVLIPSTDGGYVLIALKGHHPSVFEGISWSTDQVLRQTLTAADRLKLKASVLEPMCDIDVPADLGHVPKHMLPTDKCS